jgi:hypothetical protein
MKLNRQQFEKVKNTIKYIANKFDEFEGLDENLCDENIEEFIDCEFDMPDFWFPGEHVSFTISTEDFLELADEIITIEMLNNSIIKTTNIRYYIVKTTDPNQEHIIRNFYNLKTNTTNDISIDLVTENIIVGLAATSTGEYDKDWYGTVSPYLAIEIKYKPENVKLSPDDEIALVNSYLFEVADSTGIALRFSEIKCPIIEYDDDDEDNDTGENNFSRLREIESYNEGMRLFISAIQIQEKQLKFLNFYKILEHFAPIVVNIEANELMRKKLDASHHQFENGDFIRSIFDLAKSMREKFYDEDLIKSTFNTCFDFIGLFEKLPDIIKTKVKKQICEKMVTYSTDKQKVTTAANMVGKIIYSTRNQVVHAKANYEKTGNECSDSDLECLNEFMKEACSQTIRWYNRQPQHLKLAIIQ